MLFHVKKFEICIEFVTSTLISTINVTETIQLLAKQEWLFYVEFKKNPFFVIFLELLHTSWWSHWIFGLACINLKKEYSCNES